MKQVKVVSDTTANLPDNLVRELDIQVVPYCIQFGNETFYEGEGLTREEFHGRIAGGVFPKTSQPPIGRFVDAFQAAAKDAAGIICITLTSAHSGGYASAMAAKEMVPGTPIKVVDSKAISLGSGFMAIAAARAARLGNSLSDIVSMVEDMRTRMHHFIAVDTLKYLQMGGRVSAFQTTLAGMLNIKPILFVKDGALLPYERVRTRIRSIERIVEVTESSVGRTQPVRLAVLHDQAEEECLNVLATLKSRLNVLESFTAELDLALTAHSGPHMVGIISYAVGPNEP
jgi:fatty acid kinase fatty acid binding subunit